VWRVGRVDYNTIARTGFTGEYPYLSNFAKGRRASGFPFGV